MFKRIKRIAARELATYLETELAKVTTQCKELLAKTKVSEQSRIQLISYIMTNSETVLDEVHNQTWTEIVEQLAPVSERAKILLGLSIILSRLSELKGLANLAPILNINTFLEQVITASKYTTERAVTDALSEVKQELEQADSLLKEFGGNPNTIIEA